MNCPSAPLFRLQSNLLAIIASDFSSMFGCCEKGYALEALMWLQQAGSCGGGGSQQLVTPGTLVKCMTQGERVQMHGTSTRR